ncbi:metal-dependent hydrolase [Dinghuibacter silviterrae]|uniref:Uncharacterized protein n=1 Tax=Dinghuibacter silviterrae TaxID=1539049 RepID=A0A4R8DWM1_9BACT|nr:metal-dependent hydrolase [Dinghuibacter silviterrae]TDX01611.1 hypothetical protein EDB95_2652 [Dinghuibacter silviterrae]
MFIGHFGLGMGAKRLDPKPSLGTLLMAAQFLDLLWPLFLILGWEKVAVAPHQPPLLSLDFSYYPYSHSLVFALIWSVLFGGVYYAIRRDRGTALLLGALVFSHWALDYLTHIPDLPLSPWSDTKVGLGLWNSQAATIGAESILFAGGIALYLSRTRAKSWIGHLSFWSLVLLLAAFYASGFFSPPPSSTDGMGWMGMIQWILILWGYWIDRTRTVI